MASKTTSTRSQTAAAGRHKLRLLIVCAALIAATLAVYRQVNRFDFCNYDDQVYVTNNSMVLQGLTWQGAKWSFTNAQEANWHPLTYLSLMGDISLAGRNPGAMHMTNLILHLCSVVLLFAVLYSLTAGMWPSALVAALFAIHPLHVESVAWIAERKDCLSTVFWMLTMLAYVRYVRRPGFLRYAAVIVAFSLGLMAKPMLVTLPLVLILLDYWPLGRFEKTSMRSLIVEKLPLFGLIAVASGLTLWAQSVGGAMSSLDLLPLGVRLANVPVAYVVYLWKTVWPAGLVPFYPHPGVTLPMWKVMGSLAVMLILTARAVAARKRRPYVFVGWMWYLVTLLPVIGIIQVGAQAFADRYTYVPLIGLFIALAGLISSLVKETPRPCVRMGAVGGAVAVLAALGVTAHSQVRCWHDSQTLWQHAVDCYPRNAQAHWLLGGAYQARKRYDDAVSHFETAIDLKPSFADARVALGLCRAEMGQPQEAENEFRAALEIDPWNGAALHNLGILLNRENRQAEAKVYFEKLLRRKPGKVDDLVGLANSLLALRQGARAVPLLERALEMNPASRDAANNLAWTYATYPDPSVRNPGEAVRLAKLALALDGSGRASMLDTLAAAYASAGDFDQALDPVRESIDISRRNGQNGMAEAATGRMRLYEAHRPYVETP